MRENESHDAMGKLQRCLKRTFDIVGALIGLIICSPLFLLISILITYQSNGPSSSDRYVSDIKDVRLLSLSSEQ